MSRPFLNWTGKAERAAFDVPTLPLFVHERLSTQAILQSIKSHKRDRQQSLSLFADEELDVADRLLKAYEHPTPWVNRLILGDSLVVMNSLLQYEGLGGQVQMIYMDPPYGVEFGSNFQPFIRARSVKHGDDYELSREPETVQAYRDTWQLGAHSYLSYLRDRSLLCRELLGRTGSMFVQINDENLHHVREVLDEVFGQENFIAIIPFRKKTMPLGARFVESICDYLLWYAKDVDRVFFQRLYKEVDVEGDTHWNYVELADGTRRKMSREEINNHELLPAGAVPFQLMSLYPVGVNRTGLFPVAFRDKRYEPPEGNSWFTNPQGMQRLINANRIEPYEDGETLRYVLKLSDNPVSQLTNMWSDTSAPSDKIYAVQTSNRVIERCILMTTRPGDLVFDPTCGSGTSAYVSEQWGRRWITTDTSRVPLALARQRLLTATFPYFELLSPPRGPLGGFVYGHKSDARGRQNGGIVRVVTRGVVANDEQPDEILVVNRPEEVEGTTRVTGPFVVEATIPTTIEVQPRGVSDREDQYVADPIERMIEVLRRSPVLRLPKGQTVGVKNVRRPAKAISLHAEAEIDGNGGKPVSFIFGPEHGPVTEQMVFAAAREANLKNYARLFVIGFAIQPGASKLIQSCEDAVGIPATYVQATMDLLMGDLLKTTRASQIFAVTGEPDVRLLRLKKKNADGPLYQVELRGLDTFDPVTMQTEHRKGDDVPAWLLDTDYDDLVFHVSQAFFPRTSAWDALKRALRATYDDAVWEHLAGTTSEPFTAGEFKKIAVKVIDDRGNELMVVLPLDQAETER